MAVNGGTYTDPSRLTVGQWLDIWTQDYLGNVKPTTANAYKSYVKNHIRPGLGAVRLAELHPHTVQNFINVLSGLAPSSVHVLYRVLHIAMGKAVELNYIPRNPAARCVLPKAERKEIHPLTEEQAVRLFRVAAGTRIEHLVTLALFTGFRLSELLGLTWDAADFDRGTITVDKQLSADFLRGPLFSTPKSGKPRTVMPAASAFQALRKQKVKQAEQRLKAGPLWANPWGLIFTDDDGGPMLQQTAEKEFSSIRAAAGLEDFRFHDLRHPNVKPETQKIFPYNKSTGRLKLKHLYFSIDA